jgi:quercetin dioxygenase-like cupin family protein
MPRPESPQHGVTFDLGALERELRADAAYQSTGHAARTLVREPDLRVVLIAIRAGSRIAEHEADESASVHTIAGHVRLHLPDRVVELPAGRLLTLGPGLRHDVEATTDSAFVLTLGWRGAP